MRSWPLGLATLALTSMCALAGCKQPQHATRASAPELAPAIPLEPIASATDGTPREIAATAPVEIREKYGLELRASRAGFELYSRLPLRFEHHVEIADDTSRRVRAWLGLAGEPAPLDLVVSDSPNELRALHDQLGLPPSPSTAPSGEPSAEGFFPESRLILLLAAPGRNLEWLVSHEVCHAVFREATRSHPVSLNEGLAELLPSWILFSDASAPEETRARYADYEAVLARLDLALDVPRLESFLDLSWGRFHAERWRNFALAWCLAKLLVESDDPEVHGRFVELTHTLGSHGRPWDDFRAVYDGERVERLWRASIAEYARSR